MLTIPDSLWVDLDGPVHYVSFGGPQDAPRMVLVHGLGGSHVNWAALGPLLAQRYRVTALDLAGFGHTASQGRPTTVAGNQRLVHRFVTEVVGAPAVLVGNSMGGAISILEAAEHPDAVAGLVLLDPALPPHPLATPDPKVLGMFATYITPKVGQRFIQRRQATRTPEQVAQDLLDLCLGDPSRVDPDLVRAHADLARNRQYYKGIGGDFVVATRSVLDLMRRPRSYRRATRAVSCPVLMVHGTRDRLVHVRSARAAAKAHPTWTYEEAVGVGHVPMIEVPEWTAARIGAWLDGVGARAAAVARA